MRSRLSHHYSSLYSQPLPTERSFNVWPFAVGTLTLVLAGLVAWWFVAGPGLSGLLAPPDAPTVSNRVVTLELAGQQFHVPQNYLRVREQRSGGPVERIDLYAIWPSMRGFNEGEADEFRDKGDTARIVYITLTAPARVWRPAERFYQIYPYYFAGPEERGKFGLMRRAMDEGSGLGDHDVHYYQDQQNFFLFHCLRDKSDLMPSDCFADKIIEPRILARYRFREAMLVDWREIDQGVEALLAQFAGR